MKLPVDALKGASRAMTLAKGPSDSYEGLDV